MSEDQSYFNWYVGMEVVAVRNGAAHWPAEVRAFIIAGRTYKISGINPADPIEDDFPIYIRLTGGPSDDDGDLAEFECRGFRPVQIRKTDISIFTAMLQGAKGKVQA